MDIRKRLIENSPDESSSCHVTSYPDKTPAVTPLAHNVSSRVPIRIIERRIQSFTQTTVPHDLNRLKQHKENIVQFHKEFNWTKLNLEHVNASRTVQQLKTHIQTMDELRHQLNDADQPKFVILTKGIRRDVQMAIEDYGMVCSRLLHSSDSKDEAIDQQFDSLSSVSDQSVLIPKEEAAAQSWDELRTDLLELNELIRTLQTEVKAQNRTVADIETNIDVAAANVQVGEIQLRGGSRFRSYLLPVGGAIVGGVMGGVVGGPFGALAGLKVGALTAAAAGTVGAIGGAFVGYKAKLFNGQVVAEDDKDEVNEKQGKKDI